MIAKLLIAWCLMALCVAIHAAGVTAVLRWWDRATPPPGFWSWTRLLVGVAGWMILLHLAEISAWALVFARVQVWVREQQVEQSDFVLRRAEAQKQQGFGDAEEVTQARTSYAGFRTTLIAAKADLLDREAALRNLLGLPPYDPLQIVPTTQPLEGRVLPLWEPLVELADGVLPRLRFGPPAALAVVAQVMPATRVIAAAAARRRTDLLRVGVAANGRVLVSINKSFDAARDVRRRMPASRAPRGGDPDQMRLYGNLQ